MRWPPEPPWCERFLRELKRMARNGHVNQCAAAQLAGISEQQLYAYRRQNRNQTFRSEWDRIVAEASEMSRAADI